MKKNKLGWRIKLAKKLIAIGKCIQSMAVVTMKPDELIEYSRMSYNSLVESWCSDMVVDQGLDDEEKILLDKLTMKYGHVLVLGVGGGREAIPLVRSGFQVTGLDFIPEMVERAKTNAEARGIHIDGLVQEISELDLPKDSYDIVWLSAAMYSSIPTRKKRVDMLSRIHKAMVPGGYFVCQFHWQPNYTCSQKMVMTSRFIAFLIRGNRHYEPGDMLWSGNREFIHAFSSEHLLTSEFKDGGFEIIDLKFFSGKRKGGIILRCPPIPDK